MLDQVDAYALQGSKIFQFNTGLQPVLFFCALSGLQAIEPI